MMLNDQLSRAKLAIADFNKIQRYFCTGCLVDPICRDPCEEFNQMIFQRWVREDSGTQHHIWAMGDTRMIPRVNMSLYGTSRENFEPLLSSQVIDKLRKYIGSKKKSKEDIF